MRCWLCNKKFINDAYLIPLVRYVENERHGDFATDPVKYIHAFHLKELAL